jgi:hypothetical protein
MVYFVLWTKIAAHVHVKGVSFGSFPAARDEILSVSFVPKLADEIRFVNVGFI